MQRLFLQRNWGIHLQGSERDLYKERVKPILDIFFACLLVIFFLPTFIIIAFLLKITTQDSVIYQQQRIGKNGQEFNIYKFRSMTGDAPILVGAERATIRKKVTKVGRFLRNTSLDELPQLFNVLQGDMSLIGPRPVVANEQELLDLRRESGVDSLMPGITGLAQIKGRKKLTDEQKAEFDAEYAREVSLFCDLSIIFKTIPVIIVREGVQKLFKKH